MRRKVLQDFANVFCQRLLDLPDGHDVASFAHYGSGTYLANVLTSECTFNGKSIPALRLCVTYRDWLREQSEKHRIPYEQIGTAAFEVQVVVKDVNLRAPYGHRFASATSFSSVGAKSRPTKSRMSDKWLETRNGVLTGITNGCMEDFQMCGQRQRVRCRNQAIALKIPSGFVGDRDVS